jgi:hypothetical protein
MYLRIFDLAHALTGQLVNFYIFTLHCRPFYYLIICLWCTRVSQKWALDRGTLQGTNRVIFDHNEPITTNKSVRNESLNYYSSEEKKKLRGFVPLANYADRETAACWRSSANFCGYRVLRGQRNGSRPSLVSVFLTGAATISSK